MNEAFKERQELLLEALENLNHQYRKAARPFLEELSKLESMGTGLDSHTLTREQWASFAQLHPPKTRPADMGTD